MPTVADETCGNAATMYLLAFARMQETTEPQVDEAAVRSKGLPEPTGTDLVSYYLEEVPLERLPLQDVESAVNQFGSAMHMLASATARAYCRWDLPTRETGYETLLPHLNIARYLANVVA